MGPVPIEWTDISAFCLHAGLRLAPWEVAIVEALDDAWLLAMAKDAPKPGDPKRPVISDRPMSAAVFDAIF